MDNELAGRSRCLARLASRWPSFLERRASMLAQQDRYGSAAEKVAENIVTDLLSGTLDWPMQWINYQVGRADLIITRQLIKVLVVETKRPGSLAWHRRAMEEALDQAERYAFDQKVGKIAVSDGTLIYAVDLVNGIRRARMAARLDAAEAPQELWWLSRDGIVQDRRDPEAVAASLPPAASPESPSGSGGSSQVLHPHHRLPRSCFACQGDPTDPKSWKLPYLRIDGTIDTHKLPAAIGALVRTYRGELVHIPETTVPAALLALGRAAAQLGKLPRQGGKTTATYRDLQAALDQLGLLDQIDL